MYNCSPHPCRGEYVCVVHAGPDGWVCAGCRTAYFRESTRAPLHCERCGY